MRRIVLILMGLLMTGAVLLTPSYVRYVRTRGAVPPGVRLAGLSLGSADSSEVIAALNRQLAEPVAVYYGDERIILRPSFVRFEVDATAMLAEAQSYETPTHLVWVWVNEALHRPLAPVEIPLRYRLDRDALDNWLADVARRYDRVAVPPRADLSALTLLPGQSGRQLDLPASRERVIAALTDPQMRTANLVVRETAAPPMHLGLLADLLRARSSRFPGLVGLFLRHTPSGQEVALNADVAFSGMSTVKIAILVEAYRAIESPPDARVTRLITETIALAGNAAANDLLALIGGGDADAGVRTLNASLRRLGLHNTFLAAPYGQYPVGARVATPANTRPDLKTQPDPYIQTTPADIGLLLEMVIACSQGGGTLLAAYPGELTPAECGELLSLMRFNEVTDLIPRGLPPDTRVVHKHGYISHTHGDVAAIWGPAGPYVLSIFLYRPPWLEWEFSSQTMADLTALTWQYFTLTARP